MNNSRKEKLKAKDVYHIISDTVTGINIRKTDNFIQLKIVTFIVFIFELGAFIWKYYHANFFGFEDNLGTSMISLILGLLAGGFISGTYIAFYRFIQHLKGNHN